MSPTLRTALMAGITLGGLLAAAPAMGQIVTPPPAKAPEVDDHIVKLPPAPLPPVMAPPQIVNKPIRLTKSKQPRVEAPDLKFESIVHRDASGKLIPLSEPVDLAALRNNPAVKPGFLEDIADLLAERKAAFERVAIDNLDIVEKIDAGAIEKADYASKKGITDVVNMLKPLVPKAVPEPLTKDLLDKEKITPEQAAMNDKIMKEYKDALLPPGLGKDPTPADRAAFTAKVIGTIQHENVGEVMLTFNSLRRAAFTNVTRCMPDGLDTSKAGIVAAAAKGISATSSPADLAKSWQALENNLTIDQRRDMLRKAAALGSK